MGYTTDFYGTFTLDKPLAPEHAAYLKKFAETRRMKRNPEITATFPDPIREAAGLPVGEQGGYFVGAPDGEGLCSNGQTHTKDIIDYNEPPNGQPGLWCQWVPNEAGTEIEWDGGEKFYQYVEWLEYIIAHFLNLWGYTLNGSVEWEGEDRSDRGKIVVKDNAVSTKTARTVYRD